MLAVPQAQALRDFQAAVTSVPEGDAPGLFGLPANIDRSVQRFNSTAVIGQLKQLAAVSEGDLRFDK